MKIVRAAKGPGASFPPGDGDWCSGPLCGFDTETSGVNTETARIVSAALVIDIPGQEPIVNEWLINSGVDIDLEATAIHGISTEHAQRYGMPAAQGITEIIAALASVSYPLVVVNGAFDFSILACEAMRYGVDATSVIDKLRIVDTLVCDRMLDPYRPGRRTLTAVAASYGIAIRGAHQASGDVACAIRLARAMGRKFPEFGTCDLSRLQSIQANAYRKWALEYSGFQRMEDPEFADISTEWPYRVTIPVTTAA